MHHCDLRLPLKKINLMYSTALFLKNISPPNGGFRLLFGWNSDKVMGKCILMISYFLCKFVAQQGLEPSQRALSTLPT